MSKVKIILIACGTAIATSTVVAKAVEEILAKRGIEVITRQCKAAEVSSLASNADLVITTTPVPSDIGIPVVKTLAFITGIGKEQAIKEIIEKLEK